MSLPSRALATRTGHPVLKLVLLTVATLPGYPTANDVAAAAEMTVALTEDALSDLVAARQLSAHRSPGQPYRYALPDDGWSYTRADTDEDPETPAAAPVPSYVRGYATGPRGYTTADRVVA